MTDRIDQIEDIIDTDSEVTFDLGNVSSYNNVNDLGSDNDTKCFIYESGSAGYISSGMMENEIFKIHLKSDTLANLESGITALLKLNTDGVDTSRYNPASYGVGYPVYLTIEESLNYNEIEEAILTVTGRWIT